MPGEELDTEIFYDEAGSQEELKKKHCAMVGFPTHWETPIHRIETKRWDSVVG